MEKAWIYEEAEKLINILNEDEFPETVYYLEEIIEDIELESVIVDSDKPKPWPKEVIQYITKLYTYEIDKGNASAMNDLGAQYYDGNRGFSHN